MIRFMQLVTIFGIAVFTLVNSSSEVPNMLIGVERELVLRGEPVKTVTGTFFFFLSSNIPSDNLLEVPSFSS